MNYNIKEHKNKVEIHGITKFMPSDTFECGQCFRWNKIGDEYYEGIAYSRRIRVRKIDGVIILENTSPGDFYNIWEDYFDLTTDYDAIAAELSADPLMKKAAEAGSGIRILKQEPFETIISYIISQNNNIPRIKKITESLCALCGEPIRDENRICYAFPKPQTLIGCDLESVRSGFRAKYIADAAEKINDGIIDMNAVWNMSLDEGTEHLRQIRGVGAKVAACIMLFAYHRLDAFPVDVWIRRSLEKYYPDGEPGFLKSRYAGIANAYLFNYERNLKKNT